MDGADDISEEVQRAKGGSIWDVDLEDAEAGWDGERLLDNQEMLADDTEDSLEDDANQIEEEAIHVDNEPVQVKSGVGDGDVQGAKSIVASQASGLSAAEVEEQERLEEIRTEILHETGELEEVAREHAGEDDDQEDADWRRNQEQDKNGSVKIDGTSIDMVKSDSGASGDSSREGGSQEEDFAVEDLELEAGSGSQERFEKAVDGPDAPVGHPRVAPARGRAVVGRKTQHIFDMDRADEILAEEEIQRAKDGRLADAGLGDAEVDIDESYVKTGWEEDEELDDAFGAFSTRELAEGAVMSSSQGHAMSDGQGQQGFGGQRGEGDFRED